MKMTAFTDSEYTYLHELDLDGIKERVENTSGNEWRVEDSVWYGEYVVKDRLGGVVVKTLHGNKEDAEFIAHARQDVPALIAEVERLREENVRLREALRFYADEANHKNISFAEPYSKVASDYGHHARIALGIEGANDD